MPAENATCWFYCNGHRVTATGRCAQSVFQADKYPLAQQSAAGQVENALVAADRQHTVGVMIQPAARPVARYTAYGFRRSSPDFNTSLGFNGEWLDNVSDIYMLGNGYRAYLPNLMRFASCDRLSPFGRGGLNAYAYCQGDPINHVDPTGHSPLLAALASLAGPVLSIGALNSGPPAGRNGLLDFLRASYVASMGAGLNMASPLGLVFGGVSLAMGSMAAEVSTAHNRVLFTVTKLKPVTSSILLKAWQSGDIGRPGTLAELAARKLPAPHLEEARKAYGFYSASAAGVVAQGPQSVEFAKAFSFAGDKYQFVVDVLRDPDRHNVHLLNKDLQNALSIRSA